MSEGRDGAKIDGRRARRARGRDAVIDAVFTLLQQGQLRPDVDAVAERAGVSVSSVFRYFDNLDDLYRATIERYFDQFAPLFAVPATGQGPLDDRIARFVDARLALYQAIGPIARAARARAGDHPHLAHTLQDTRVMLAGQVREHFAPELSSRTSARADDLVALIDSLTSFEAWDLLTGSHRRTRPQVRRAWRAGLEALTGVLS